MMNEIWGKVLDNMRADINKQSFDMWFKDTKPLSVVENIFPSQPTTQPLLAFKKYTSFSLGASIFCNVHCP